jgi:hypothetical protein
MSIWTLLAASVLQSAAQIGISGHLPRGIEAPSGVTWLAADADSDQPVACILTRPGQWACDGTPSNASGLVIIRENVLLGYIVIQHGSPAEDGVVSWGRLVRVTAGDDLHDLSVAAWKPQRSAVRARANRFQLIEDPDVRVYQLSETAFWISGTAPVAESVLILQGPLIAAYHIETAAFANGPSELPLILAASPPTAIAGRVEAPPGEPAEGTDVDLLAPLPSAGGTGPPAHELARYRATRTDAHGEFEFAGLEAGTYRIVARHATLGAAELDVRAPGPAATLKLLPPIVVTGRAVRRGLPAPQVRVRFVPDALVWKDSTDPFTLLATETSTDDLGRFAVALPQMPIGTLQLVALDGLSTRIVVPSPGARGRIDVGDIRLEEPISLAVRLDALGCQLSAAGPLGQLGLSRVQATSASNMHWLDLPEVGTWLLGAECNGQPFRLEPPTVTIPGRVPLPTVDVHVVGP